MNTMIEEILQYIIKQTSPHKEILQRLHEIITSEYPNIPEEMKYGVPYYGKWFYLVALKNHVNLGVSIKKLSKDEIHQFEGTGATTRHIKINTLEDINEVNIIEKLKIVIGKD